MTALAMFVILFAVVFFYLLEEMQVQEMEQLENCKLDEEYFQCIAHTQSTK